MKNSKNLSGKRQWQSPFPFKMLSDSLAEKGILGCFPDIFVKYFNHLYESASEVMQQDFFKIDPLTDITDTVNP